MTEHDWERLPRRKQLWILRHMGVATTAAMALSNDQIERMLNGFFSALECKPGQRCAACKFGWTKPASRTVPDAAVPPPRSRTERRSEGAL